MAEPRIYVNLHPHYTYSSVIIQNGYIDQLKAYVKCVDWLNWDFFSIKGKPHEQAEIHEIALQELTFYKGRWYERDAYRDFLHTDPAPRSKYRDLSDSEYSRMIDQKVEDAEFKEAIVIYVG